jgi:hypothetical protein
MQNFGRKNMQKVWHFFLNAAYLLQKLKMAIAYKKNADFAGNCRKSLKIVLIITSSPGK